MKKNKMFYVFHLGLILSVLLSACGVATVQQSPIPLGEIYPLGQGTTSLILSECLRGAASSWMFHDGASNYIFAITYGTADGARGVAWVAFNFAQRTGIDGVFKVGQATNVADFKYITTSLQSLGWKEITVAELPLAVKSAMELAGSWLSRMPAMFLVMPGGTLDILEQGYPQAPEVWQ